VHHRLRGVYHHDVLRDSNDIMPEHIEFGCSMHICRARAQWILTWPGVWRLRATSSVRVTPTTVGMRRRKGGGRPVHRRWHVPKCRKRREASKEGRPDEEHPTLRFSEGLTNRVLAVNGYLEPRQCTTHFDTGTPATSSVQGAVTYFQSTLQALAGRRALVTLYVPIG